jgi:hypothetical protein
MSHATIFQLHKTSCKKDDFSISYHIINDDQLIFFKKTKCVN